MSRKFFALFFPSIFSMLLFSCGLGKINSPLEPLDIYVLQTRNDADCVILYRDRQAVVIDTGEAEDGPRIVSFMREHNIDTIAALILTHPDQDHIGGAPLLIREFEIKQVIQPVYPYEHEELDSLNILIRQKGIHVMQPLKRRYVSFMDLQMIIQPPRRIYYTNTNDYSLIIQAAYGNKRMLFTADALERRLREIIDVEWPAIDLLKIPHHGRANIVSAEFITKLKPAYGVVTAKQSDSAIRNACSAAGTRVFYSGLGDVHFVTDGLVFEPAGGGF